MKKWIIVLVAVLILSGCTSAQPQLDRAMELRAQMIAKEISFDCRVTADYGDRSCSFTLGCSADTGGNLTFRVTEPESIAGISGTVAGSGGKLTFDDTVLGFSLMADGQFSPVSAPWILIKTLRGGYLTSCNQENSLLRLAIDDSYEEDALHLDIWLDQQNVPVAAEVYWQGRRLLSMEISNFQMV